jgi:hypothetical protein
MADKAKKINLRQQGDDTLSLSPDLIPTLVPSEKLAMWQDGDQSPYYKVQKIEYPTKANGYNYLESFWESFIGKLNTQLIPGSKDGHETKWGARAATDFLLVGGKIEKNGDGSGTAFLKNYIPPSGESGDNSIFIKENKTGMVDYSLVAYTRDVIEDIDGTREWNVVESLYGERNDAVGYGEGAMEQKTNSRDSGEGDIMSKKAEVLATLKTLKTNAEVTLPEIAESLGLSDQIITEDQSKMLSSFGRVKKLCGEIDPIDFITGLIEEKKANAESVREAKMTEFFGPKTNKETGAVNHARDFASTLLGDGELTEEKINEVKESEIFKKLASDLANKDSDYNRITDSGEKPAEASGPVVL